MVFGLVEPRNLQCSVCDFLLLALPNLKEIGYLQIITEKELHSLVDEMKVQHKLTTLSCREKCNVEKRNLPGSFAVNIDRDISYYIECVYRVCFVSDNFDI